MFKSRKYELRARRKRRIRRVIRGTPDRPRVSFYKSLKYLYTQVIDDMAGRTLLSLSTLSKELREKLKSKKNIEAAKALGERLGELLKEHGINKVVLDRSGYKYHGRLKSFADAVRSKGIEF